MDWQALVLLGAYHGINPGMGWLFAVALGMQQQSARGVLKALPPIALGHALAVAVVLLAVAIAGLAVPPDALQVIVGVMLMTLGLYRLWRHRHPRFGGMQVGFRDLTAWSFLMASAHGAGLMVLPFVMPAPTSVAAAAHDHARHMTSMAAAGANVAEAGLTIVFAHTLAYLAVTTLVAWIVYARLGVGFLRKAWINMDWVWAGALVVTGLVAALR
jgi:hypothetical protein